MKKLIADYRTDLEQAVTRLLAMKIEDGTLPSVEIRKKKINDLLESYITKTNKIPPGEQVQRLANWLLYEQLTNQHPDKVSRTEYPVMNNRQLRMRYRREKAVENLQERYFRARN